jgi:hypothetical protein
LKQSYRIELGQSTVIRAEKHSVTTELKIESFSRDRQLFIERDLYYKLEIKIFNLSFLWPNKVPPKKKKKSIFQESKNTQLSAAVDENGITQA